MLEGDWMLQQSCQTARGLGEGSDGRRNMETSQTTIKGKHCKPSILNYLVM